MKHILEKQHLKNIDNIMMVIAVEVSVTTIKMKIAAKMKRTEKLYK